MEQIKIYEDSEKIYIQHPQTGVWFRAYMGVFLGMNVYELDFEECMTSLEGGSESKNLEGHVWKPDTKYIIEKKTLPITFN